MSEEMVKPISIILCNISKSESGNCYRSRVVSKRGGALFDIIGPPKGIQA
jgi:hypothetical protein